MSKNSQVAEKKQTAVAVIDEAMFEQDQGKGLENVGMEDLALPFLKVLSRQDPLLDDLENGTFIILSLVISLKVRKV